MVVDMHDRQYLRSGTADNMLLRTEGEGWLLDLCVSFAVYSCRVSIEPHSLDVLYYYNVKLPYFLNKS